MSSLPPEIVFFDGGCLFCQQRVRWLWERDRGKRLAFAPLDGPTARAVLGAAGRLELMEELSTMVFAEKANEPRPRLWLKSRAIAAICRRLPFPWRCGACVRWMPRLLADGVYDWAARRRHRWGKAETCPVWPEGERARFLP